MTTILGQHILDPVNSATPDWSQQATLKVDVDELPRFREYQVVPGNGDWEYYRHGSFIEVRSTITGDFQIPRDLGELNTTRSFAEPLVQVWLEVGYPGDVQYGHNALMELRRARRLVNKVNDLRPITLEEKAGSERWYTYAISTPAALKGDIIFNLERGDKCCLYCETTGKPKGAREVDTIPTGSVTYPHWGRAVQACPAHKTLVDRNMALERKSSS